MGEAARRGKREERVAGAKSRRAVCEWAISTIAAERKAGRPNGAASALAGLALAGQARKQGGPK
jgi:hypothetical protein